MNWPAGVLGRALAAVYLVACPVLYVGVVWTLIGQLTGDGTPQTPAIVLFLVGALLIIGLSFVLGRWVPERRNKLTKNMRGSQLAYFRLGLGFELWRAWRVVRGERAAAGEPN
ncbi:hypothetical protein AB0E63_07195 [Kribbella sp. NPDC026596]|uniref:hypothetical protein n=1 Tax=Kribbella sp. NPDC026596 TaxID=3155122 RepID=UPI0033D12D9A